MISHPSLVNACIDAAPGLGYPGSIAPAAGLIDGRSLVAAVFPISFTVPITIDHVPATLINSCRSEISGLGDFGVADSHKILRDDGVVADSVLRDSRN